MVHAIATRAAADMGNPEPPGEHETFHIRHTVSLPNGLVINADGPGNARSLWSKTVRSSNSTSERRRRRGIVNSNIYKAKCCARLPCVQAAFVDIGTDKPGASCMSPKDVRSAPEDIRCSSTKGRSQPAKATMTRPRCAHRICCGGQEVIVQIRRRLRHQGRSRSTSYISLPGRNFWCLCRRWIRVGISAGSVPEKEQSDCSIVDSMRPPGTGFIVRTVRKRAKPSCAGRTWSSSSSCGTRLWQIRGGEGSGAALSRP